MSTRMNSEDSINVLPEEQQIENQTRWLWLGYTRTTQRLRTRLGEWTVKGDPETGKVVSVEFVPAHA